MAGNVGRQSTVRGGVPFTTEELMYLKYGEGIQGLVHRRDERYMQLIRSQMARPALGKPAKIDNISPVGYAMLGWSFSCRPSSFGDIF
jgi:hypothetical protein